MLGGCMGKSIPTCTHCSMLIEPIRLPVKKVPLATNQAQGKDQITSFNKTNTVDLHKHIRIAKYGCLHRASRLPKLYTVCSSYSEPPMVHRHLKKCHMYHPGKPLVKLSQLLGGEPSWY